MLTVNSGELMKLSSKEVEEVVGEAVGADIVPLIKKLEKRKNFSEFKLADALGKDVNETRHLLYKLYQHNLVYFVRKKDQKKGWYIYYWNFNLAQARIMVAGIKKEKTHKLMEKLKKEKEGSFFACSNSCVRLEFEHAVDFNFKCPECGEVMNHENNSETINKIQKELNVLSKKKS